MTDGATESRFTEEDILELAQMYEEAGFDNDPPPAWYTARYGRQQTEEGVPDTTLPQYEAHGEIDPNNQTPNDNLLTRPTGAPLRFRTKDLKPTHKYGCLMLMLPDDVRKQITDWVLEEVPDFHLGKGGREFSSHVTLFYDEGGGV